MSTLILTRGIQGSGKSEWAKHWVQEDPEHRIRLNRDDLRRTLYATTSTLLTGEQEKFVSVVEKNIARDALRRGLGVVVDATNLNSRWVRDWMRLGYPVTFKDFPIELHVALARNALREKPVPREVIEKAYMRYTLRGELPRPPVQPTPTPAPEPYEQDWDLPTAVIVDLDGTLAHNVTGRSFYDMDRVGEDEVDDNVRAFVNTLNTEHHIIVLSGRKKTGLHATQLWLQKHFINHDYLYMRESDDDRPDHIIKRELFDAHIRHQFNVLGVIDDRPSVCRGWRALGVKTFQVGDPNKEF